MNQVYLILLCLFAAKTVISVQQNSAAVVIDLYNKELKFFNCFLSSSKVEALQQIPENIPHVAIKTLRKAENTYTSLRGEILSWCTTLTNIIALDGQKHVAIYDVRGFIPKVIAELNGLKAYFDSIEINYVQKKNVEDYKAVITFEGDVRKIEVIHGQTTPEIVQHLTSLLKKSQFEGNVTEYSIKRTTLNDNLIYAKSIINKALNAINSSTNNDDFDTQDMVTKCRPILEESPNSRADYWKSNERKYCDFCKCWISDNKASIAFHESGKRHKLNVAKRITDISRNSEKAERERQKMDVDIRKMEEAAMRSYAQDIHRGGDFTARSINAVLDAHNSANSATASTSAVAGREKQVDPVRLPGNSDDEDEVGKRVRVQKVQPESVPNASLWVEGVSDGYTYYWNVKTNESVWEPPKEGYLSYAEYQHINELALKKQEIEQVTEAKKFRENVDEDVARYNREQLKMFRKPETPQELQRRREVKESYKTQEEAAARTIGVWQAVELKPPLVPIDLELPRIETHYVPPVVSEVPAEPPVKRFKEKTIVSLDPTVAHGVPTSFKKRKFAAKANQRQRLNVE